MEDLSTAIQCHQPLVVGAVGDQKVLELIITDSDCDLIELRLDSLGVGSEVHEFAANNSASHPLLLTARHPDEGGEHALSCSQRASLYQSMLSLGSLIDLELRSVAEMADLWSAAQERGLLRIASWHNFESCPEISELRDTFSAMQDAGADIAKCAFRLQQPSDLQRVAECFEEPPLPLAIMGMGPLAPASRLLAASLGSVLNYGYLGQNATAPGQWPARLLKEAIGYVPQPVR